MGLGHTVSLRSGSGCSPVHGALGHRAAGSARSAGQAILHMKDWAGGCLPVWSGQGSAVSLWAEGLEVEAVEDLGVRRPRRHPALGSIPLPGHAVRTRSELGWAPAGAQVASRSRGPRLGE